MGKTGHRPWTQPGFECQPRETQGMMGRTETLSRCSQTLFCVGHQNTGNQALGSSLNKALLLSLILGDQAWPQGSVQAPPCRAHPSSFQPKPLGRVQVPSLLQWERSDLGRVCPNFKRLFIVDRAWVCTLCEFQHNLFCFYPSRSVRFPLMALVS